MVGRQIDEQRRFLDDVSARPHSNVPNQLPNHTHWRFYILSTKDSKYDFDIKPSMSHSVRSKLFRSTKIEYNTTFPWFLKSST